MKVPEFIKQMHALQAAIEMTPELYRQFEIDKDAAQEKNGLQNIYPARKRIQAALRRNLVTEARQIYLWYVCGQMDGLEFGWNEAWRTNLDDSLLSSLNLTLSED